MESNLGDKDLSTVSISISIASHQDAFKCRTDCRTGESQQTREAGTKGLIGGVLTRANVASLRGGETTAPGWILSQEGKTVYIYLAWSLMLTQRGKCETCRDRRSRN